MVEVLVALVIAASAAAIILTHLRGLTDLSWRLRRQQTETSQLLNEAAQLTLPDWSSYSTHTLREDDVAISLQGEAAPSVFVSNFNLQEAVEPVPIDRAYTPYQIYRVRQGERRSLALLYPNLPLEY